MSTTIPKVRKVSFPQTPLGDMCWTPRRPEFACLANSVSLLMPYIEPYFVRSVVKSIPELEGSLLEQTRAYVGQETQHHVQHRLFNTSLVAQYPNVGRVERAAQKSYRWLEHSRSERFNLAFAAGSEAVAYSIARWAASREKELFGGADPALSSLFLWHLAEEVEHKSVVFDVYAQVDGNRFRYVLATVLSVLLLAFFVLLGTVSLLVAEKRIWKPIAWFRLVRWFVTFVFELLPTLFLSCFASFHPDQLTDPFLYQVFLEELAYEKKTVRSP